MSGEAMSKDQCCNDSQASRAIGLWSVDRQVRAVSGSLVLLGVILAYTINPIFVLLTVVVALGMLVSACTNSCAMGSVISQMPWNKEAALAAERDEQNSMISSPGES